MKNKAAASALRMSAADDEVAKLRAAAQKAREEAQALAKVSLPFNSRPSDIVHPA